MRSAPKPSAERSRLAATSANTSTLLWPYLTFTSSPLASAHSNFGVHPSERAQAERARHLLVGRNPSGWVRGQVGGRDGPRRLAPDARARAARVRAAGRGRRPPVRPYGAGARPPSRWASLPADSRRARASRRGGRMGAGEEDGAGRHVSVDYRRNCAARRPSTSVAGSACLLTGRGAAATRIQATRNDADHLVPPCRERAGRGVDGRPCSAAAAGPADSHGGICDLAAGKARSTGTPEGNLGGFCFWGS